MRSCCSPASFAVAGAEVIEQILVKVNGEIFTKSDLEARQVAALRQQLGQQVDLKSDPSDAQLRKMLNDVTPDLIVSVVDEMLVVQRGKELGYKLGEEQFQSVLANIKKDNKIESDEQLQAALKQENMTLADLRRNLERQMLMQRVQQNEVLGRIAVSQEEARKYYDAHQSEFTKPQTITLREITVAVPGDGTRINVGIDEEAREKTEQIRGRLLAGESFEKLAADLSDSPSRANAGLIGPFSVGDLAADLRKRIETMKVGDISEILRSPTRISDPEAGITRRRPRPCRSSRRANRFRSVCLPTSAALNSKSIWRNCAPRRSSTGGIRSSRRRTRSASSG